jgi:hypothetical protein
MDILMMYSSLLKMIKFKLAIMIKYIYIHDNFDESMPRLETKYFNL